MTRHDTEIAADVGDDGADGPTSDLRGNLFRRGQASEAGIRRVVGLRGGGSGGRRFAMRLSLALSFSALVVAEMIGADAGLGYLIIDSRNFFRMANMFLAASLIGVEYTLFSLILSKLEKRLFRWRKTGLTAALER